MDVRELRLRLTPWIALTLGLAWVCITLISKRAAVTWHDVYPGASLIAASFVLFATIKWLNRPYEVEQHDTVDEVDPDQRLTTLQEFRSIRNLAVKKGSNQNDSNRVACPIRFAGRPWTQGVHS